MDPAVSLFFHPPSRCGHRGCLLSSRPLLNWVGGTRAERPPAGRLSCRQGQKSPREWAQGWEPGRRVGQGSRGGGGSALCREAPSSRLRVCAEGRVTCVDLGRGAECPTLGLDQQGEPGRTPLLPESCFLLWAPGESGLPGADTLTETSLASNSHKPGRGQPLKGGVRTGTVMPGQAHPDPLVVLMLQWPFLWGHRDGEAGSAPTCPPRQSLAWWGARCGLEASPKARFHPTHAGRPPKAHMLEQQVPLHFEHGTSVTNTAFTVTQRVPAFWGGTPRAH